jgi:hypothetical protein
MYHPCINVCKKPHCIENYIHLSKNTFPRADTILIFNFVIEHVMSSETDSLLQTLFPYIDQLSLQDRETTVSEKIIVKKPIFPLLLYVS